MRTLSETLSFNSTTNVYTPTNRIQYLRNNGTLMDSSYHQSYNSTTQKYDTLNKYGFIHYNGLLLHEHSYTFNQVDQGMGKYSSSIYHQLLLQYDAK